MKSNPKYKKVSVQSSNLKQSQRYVKNLQEQLHQSKIAVENITTFKFMEQELRKKIDFIQSDLHNCMLKINSETKKQKVLEDLISLMKGEEFNFQNKLKNEDQIININLSKQIHRIQNDIQQILQNHNEQVAKINILKQQASSFRSQRVVYSNLFKKLEKQIQHYEQIYKFQLLKTEVTKKKCKENQIPNLNMLKTIDAKSHFSNIFCDQKSKENNFNQMEENYTQKQLQFPRNNLFITSTKENHVQKSKKVVNGSSLESKLDVIPKSLSHCILVYEQQLRKIKVYAGSNSFDELIEHYETLEQQNSQFIGLIEQTNYSIQVFKTENERIAKYIVSTNRQLIQNCPDQLNCQDQGKQNMIEKDLNNNANLDIVLKMLNIFNMKEKGSVSNQCQIDEQLLGNMYCRIQQIVFEQKKENNGWKNREQTVVSQVLVDTLLEKMDILSNCEKIMDKSTFQQEYYKEINKGRKHNKTKKI